MPTTVLEPAVMLHPPTTAQMRVTPLEVESAIVPDAHEYDPAAKVIVAPSLALLTAACTSAIDDPAVQDHVVPLPVHVPCAAAEVNKKSAAKMRTRVIIALGPPDQAAWIANHARVRE